MGSRYERAPWCYFPPDDRHQAVRRGAMAFFRFIRAVPSSQPKNSHAKQLPVLPPAPSPQTLAAPLLHVCSPGRSPAPSADCCWSAALRPTSGILRSGRHSTWRLTPGEPTLSGVGWSVPGGLSFLVHVSPRALFLLVARLRPVAERKRHVVRTSSKRDVPEEGREALAGDVPEIRLVLLVRACTSHDIEKNQQPLHSSADSNLAVT